MVEADRPEPGGAGHPHPLWLQLSSLKGGLADGEIPVSHVLASSTTPRD